MARALATPKLAPGGPGGGPRGRARSEPAVSRPVAARLRSSLPLPDLGGALTPRQTSAARWRPGLALGGAGSTRRFFDAHLPT